MTIRADLTRLHRQADAACSPIPSGALVWVDIAVTAVRTSAQGNQYLTCRLHVPSGHPWQHRTFFHAIPLECRGGNEINPHGLRAVQAVIFSTGGDLRVYDTAQDIAVAIDGSRVGVRLGINPGDHRLNVVQAFLCPDPSFGTSEDWQRLQAETEAWTEKHGETARTPLPPQQRRMSSPDETKTVAASPSSAVRMPSRSPFRGHAFVAAITPSFTSPHQRHRESAPGSCRKSRHIAPSKGFSTTKAYEGNEHV